MLMFVNVYANGKTIVKAEPIASHDMTRPVFVRAFYEHGLRNIPDYDVLQTQDAADAACKTGPRQEA